MRRRPVRAALATAVAAALGLATSAARAAGDGEWQLSARLGGGTVSIDHRKPWGLVGALDVEYGLNDAWAVRVSTGSSVHPVSANANAGLPGGKLLATTALVGATYTFDVLRLIPYADLSLGLVRFSGAVVRPRSTLATELGIGADYLLAKRWACGLSFQYLFVPRDLLSDPMNLGTSPFAFSATFRGSFIF